jgi:magnesium chelatase family protein
MQIFSFSPFGYEGALVAVEVDLRRGIPAVDVVGLADGAVRESRERMRSAIRNSGFEFPLERVLISLSPADLRKEGAGFDLAIALAVLDSKKTLHQNGGDSQSASGAANPLCIPSDSVPVLVMGELELSGLIRPVRGVHAAAATAAASGITHCIVSAANGDEAREVTGMHVFAAQNLVEAFDALYHTENFTAGTQNEKNAFVPPKSVGIDGVLFPSENPEYEFGDIIGQKVLVRALQVSAAGSHNLLAYGPPGCGKTLAIQRFSELLPLLTVEEAQSVTRIYSLAGILSPSEPLMRIPPFRMPHQTASIEGMCGGGINCRPGEISLAHNGVLFLDEASEFRTSVLQMLRVPLESGQITLSRAGRSTTYPAQFQLMLAANPCPCGNYGTSGKICLCSAQSVEKYWGKFSGPLLDRIDIRVPVTDVTDEDSRAQNESTADLRRSIASAVRIQRTRQGKRNARLNPQEIYEFCHPSPEAQRLLDSAARSNSFSQRAVSSCLKISRTIADMEGSSAITAAYMQEAIKLRKSDGPLAMTEAV